MDKEEEKGGRRRTARAITAQRLGRRGEGRREKGEGRREKGEGRREKGEGRREKGGERGEGRG